MGCAVTGRSTKEWIGKTPDQKVPPRVKLRVFEDHDGICHISKRKIRPGEAWDLDHVIALCNGGEHRESNFAPALVKAHKTKTAEDVKEKAKIAKTRKAILGIKSKGRPVPGSKNSNIGSRYNKHTGRFEAYLR